MVKDTSCWLNGMFFYTPLYFEVSGLRAEVEGMNDFDLVDEITTFYNIEHEEVDNIICEFSYKGALSDKDREALVTFYVLASMQDFLIIQEKEEW